MDVMDAASRYASAVQSTELADRVEQETNDAHAAAVMARDESYRRLLQAKSDLLTAAKTVNQPATNTAEPR